MIRILKIGEKLRPTDFVRFSLEKTEWRHNICEALRRAYPDIPRVNKFDGKSLTDWPCGYYGREVKMRRKAAVKTSTNKRQQGSKQQHKIKNRCVVAFRPKPPKE